MPFKVNIVYMQYYRDNVAVTNTKETIVKIL